ncbi:DUF982 domain-containing protein [Ancylobacter sp.]|uniref:DUF982 domain-containing protein n=1 Tax=Ancylobacter sp. TaxID=1872567 RepID=UPI003C7A8B87
MIPIAPVHVWEGNATRRTLGDLEGAANFLLIKWPSEMMDTSAHRAAQVAALDALGGHGAAEAFRSALIAASAEAGILAAETAMQPAAGRPEGNPRHKRRR